MRILKTYECGGDSRVENSLAADCIYVGTTGNIYLHSVSADLEYRKINTDLTILAPVVLLSSH